MKRLHEKNERGSSTVLFPIIGGLTAFSVLTAMNLFDAEQDLRQSRAYANDVQGYNADIHTQLIGEYAGLNGLVLTNSEGQKFTFHMTDEQGRPETCHGAYEVHHDVAQAVGQISCNYIESLTTRAH